MSNEPITLTAGDAEATVLPGNGGRIGGLRVGGTELLRQGERYGCFPMVPWCGRIRDGRFSDGAVVHQMPLNSPPHAIHGTARDAAWHTARVTADEAVITYDLTDPWPYSGRVTQVIALYVMPLLAVSEERVKAGRNPLFQSHMWDGSAETLSDNLAIAQELLERARAAKIILEVEITPTGGEEDGVSHEINDSLYTTVDDAVRTVEALGLGEKGRYLLAASFGNVHGVYKPGNVVLRPELLKELNEGIASKYGQPAGSKPFNFVFHGGSGSTAEEIATALENGVVKMNIDTDTQYAFTRPVVDHMFRNYDGVLKVDGEVGNKKTYDPRTWGKLAEAGMAARVVEACGHLRSAGQKIK
ncbi:D-tagatose-1,6-bisphosphate aldolase subunit GatY [Streptomyces tendae]